MMPGGCDQKFQTGKCYTGKYWTSYLMSSSKSQGQEEEEETGRLRDLETTRCDV